VARYHENSGNHLGNERIKEESSHQDSGCAFGNVDNPYPDPYLDAHGAGHIGCSGVAIAHLPDVLAAEQPSRQVGSGGGPEEVCRQGGSEPNQDTRPAYAQWVHF
jgi:hypothetical protein